MRTVRLRLAWQLSSDRPKLEFESVVDKNSHALVDAEEDTSPHV